MSNHPWGGSTPEMNATMLETGSTSATWAAASAAWMGLASAAMAAAGITGAQMAASTTSMSGVRSMTHAAATPPFLSWLGGMAGIAFKQAAIAAVVAESYGMARSSMIPSMQSINNRVREAAAEASNIFGQNTPLIGALNAEYGFYTAENASIGATYGEVITAATLPVPIPPPPPLGNAAKSAGEAAQATGQAAQMANQAAQGASQSASQATQGGASGDMGSMMSQFGQMLQAPMQALQSAGSGMGNPMQSLSQLMSAPMSMFGGSSQLGDLLGGGATGSSFAPVATGSGRGLPLGGAGLGSGGGLGGGMPANLSKMTSSGSSANQRVSMLSGIANAPVQERLAGATAAPMGGGGGGMPMGAAAHGAGGQSRRASDATASVLTYGQREEPTRRGADRSERDLFT
jgi:PPE-repeat protein